MKKQLLGLILVTCFSHPLIAGESLQTRLVEADIYRGLNYRTGLEVAASTYHEARERFRQLSHCKEMIEKGGSINPEIGRDCERWSDMSVIRVAKEKLQNRCEILADGREPSALAGEIRCTGVSDAKDTKIVQKFKCFSACQYPTF
jgi:hypothetical protein